MSRDNRIDVARELSVITLDLKTLIRMVEDEQSCQEIIRKLGTIRKSLCYLRRSLIAHQFQESIFVIQNHPDSKIQMLELSRLRELCIEYIKKI